VVHGIRRLGQSIVIDIARGRTLGLRIGGGPPEELRQIMDKVTEIYAKVVKSANIKPE
jgi:hypothetical protein